MARPNIVLLMCDDLGYGDTGFNGSPVIRTPHLDAMRAAGTRFTRYFAGGPVCSPTRGTCLTGRHYARYGITHANEGCLPTQEVTLAQVCRERGYRTGHFGKWHLGTLTRDRPDGNRGGKPERAAELSPPWWHDFEVCFSTEAKVPTWDPMVTPDERGPRGFRWGQPGTPFGTAYWDEDGRRVDDNLDGDDSRVIMDRAVPFIRDSVAAGRPFLSVIWFHAPHTPVVAGPDHRALYADHDEDEQHYYGCITAMDEQVGRLRGLLDELGVADDTMVWFCSDNGPEGGLDLSRNGRSRGRTGGLRGRKRSLFNGGIGVPALLTWPRRVTAGADLDTPSSTLDILPTVTDVLDWDMPDDRPIDGDSLLPVLDGTVRERPRPIPYRFLEREAAMFGSPTLALIDGDWKYLTNLSEDGAEDLLFDLGSDMAESRNVIAGHGDRAAAMRAHLRGFIDSCRHSHAGGDYPDPYEPVNAFQDVFGRWRE